jgi:hypothetical protein
MKFNKHNSYRAKKAGIECPKCKSNVNVVKMVYGYRCNFCNIMFYEKEKGGQQKL